MVLGKLPVLGRPTIWITIGQGPTALVVGAVGVVWTFLLSSVLFSPLSPSLWETARYRLKYCLKGPLNHNNQPTGYSNIKKLFLPIFILIYNKNNHKQRNTTSKTTNEPKQKSRLGTASNKITEGLQLVYGRPTLALSSALVPQTLSCSVCVEDS